MVVASRYEVQRALGKGGMGTVYCAYDPDLDRQVAHEPQGQDQHHRRDVDAAEIGQDVADRPKRRLRQAVQRIGDGEHDAIVRVHHIEGDQPRQDRAQDAVQEALVLAWRHIRAVRDPDAWDAWLYRTTVRACYRLARTEKRRDLVELHVEFDPETPGAFDLAKSVVDRDQLGRELGRLPIDQRAVMVLHFYVDLPLTEVAGILDIPVGTVKSRLHRGLEALRSTMDADRYQPVALASERSR